MAIYLFGGNKGGWVKMNGVIKWELAPSRSFGFILGHGAFNLQFAKGKVPNQIKRLCKKKG